MPIVIYGGQYYLPSICWLSCPRSQEIATAGRCVLLRTGVVLSTVTHLFLTFITPLSLFSLNCPQWHCFQHLLTEKSQFLGCPDQGPKAGVKHSTRYGCEWTWGSGLLLDEANTEKRRNPESLREWSRRSVCVGWSMPTSGLVMQGHESPQGFSCPQWGLWLLAAKSILTRQHRKGLFVIKNMYAWESLL